MTTRVEQTGVTICVNCETVLTAEGRGWVHFPGGGYRCPWPFDGDGWAEPVDTERWVEKARDEGYADGYREGFDDGQRVAT